MMREIKACLSAGGKVLEEQGTRPSAGNRLSQEQMIKPPQDPQERWIPGVSEGEAST